MSFSLQFPIPRLIKLFTLILQILPVKPSLFNASVSFSALINGVINIKNNISEKAFKSIYKKIDELLN